MKNTSLREKGITLIALVITIIVLIIISAVSYNLFLGKNGIIERARTATEQNRRQSLLEELELKIVNVQIEKKGEATLNDLIEAFKADNENEYIINLTKIASIKGEIPSITSETQEIFVIYKGYEFRIDNNLKVTFISDLYQEPTIVKEDATLEENDGKIVIQTSEEEKLKSIKITKPDTNTYNKTFSNDEDYHNFEYPIYMTGEYKVDIKTENKDIQKTVSIDETETIKGKKYYLIYGIEDLEKFITRVKNGETTINAKIINDINTNLFETESYGTVNLIQDGNSFRSTSFDPIIQFSMLPVNLSAIFIEFENPTSKRMNTEIYYANKNDALNERQKVLQTIPEGTEETVVNVPNGNFKYRYDIGTESGLSYKIKRLTYIPDFLEENNWNSFVNVFKGEIIGNNKRIIVLKNNIEYYYKNLTNNNPSYTCHVTTNGKSVTITGNDPYFGYYGNFKNVCGLKTDLSPNKMGQYFYAYKEDPNLSESKSYNTTSQEISLTKRDYTQFRFDFQPYGGTFTLNALYCKYCIDRKDKVYDGSGNTTEELYAKSVKVDEKNEGTNAYIKGLVVEYIAPNT
jgi:Tfp pilus assembly protein PilE